MILYPISAQTMKCHSKLPGVAKNLHCRFNVTYGKFHRSYYTQICFIVFRDGRSNLDFDTVSYNEIFLQYSGCQKYEST